jgi:altronate dehydratase large subunit
MHVTSTSLDRKRVVVSEASLEEAERQESEQPAPAKVMLLDSADNVATALQHLRQGTEVTLSGKSVRLREDIPFGHKLALCDLAPGEPVIKYGERIGLTVVSVEQGGHVHIHNLESARSLKEQAVTPHLAPLPVSPRLLKGKGRDEFQGYRRADGAVGIRNHVLVIPTVVCANHVCERIAAEVPGVVVISHPLGCDQGGEDLQQTLRTLIGFGTNPNVGAVLVVGLGCEVLACEQVVQAIQETGKPVHALTIQECGGTVRAIAAGIQKVRDFLDEISRCPRVACGIAELVIGLECGGSDATSGLAANPAVGYVSDKVVAAEGTVILCETLEFAGGEHILARRARDEEVAQALLGIVKAAETEVEKAGVNLREVNPSPGNIRGGLTTIEEKSLGCILKAGTSVVQGVLAYAQAPAERGLFVMDTPCQDVVSLTGMIAGRAALILFTTGRGSPVGSPIAPVIKIIGNARTFQVMRDNMDIDASPIIAGTRTLEAVGEEVYGALLDVASGHLTKAEILGHREFAIARRGLTF